VWGACARHALHPGQLNDNDKLKINGWDFVRVRWGSVSLPSVVLKLRTETLSD
jgi:hypothetical protein